jgi:hypothetical protein
MTEKERIRLINRYKALSTDRIKDLINEDGFKSDAYSLLIEEAKSRGLTIIDDSWICEQIDILLNKCPFIPNNQPFLLNPDTLYGISNPKDQAIFLMERYGLPFDEIPVYLHSGLEQPGRVEIVREYETSSLQLDKNQSVMQIKDDGTYSVFDKTDVLNPKILIINNPLSVRRIKISLFLNQDYIAPRESMAAIIAHEISHVYLYFKGLQKFKSSSEYSNKNDEYVTDINALVIGLGNIMLNGCGEKKKTFRRGNNIIEGKSKLGYLSYKQMELVQSEILSRVPVR